MSIQGNRIDLSTSVSHNIIIADYPVEEAKTLYQEHYAHNFLITQNDIPCSFKLTAYDPSLTATSTRFWGTFTCPQPIDLDHITMQATIFGDEFATYNHFASVYWKGERYQVLFTNVYNKYPEELLAKDMGVGGAPATIQPPEALLITAKKLPPAPKETVEQIEPSESATTTETVVETSNPIKSFLVVARSFIWMGMLHIFTGYDHILFLFSIILLSRKMSKLLGIITAFTIAHSITLILASFHVVEITPHIVEPAIAATIAFIAYRNIRALQKSDDAANVTSERWTLAFCFGLVHGLGFASALTEAEIPQEFFIPSLLSFNVGIELAQLCILAVVLPLLFLADKWRYRKQLLMTLAGLILVLALAWFGVRVFVGEPCAKVIPTQLSELLCI
ncbi:MAG: HupE/UreJ family protein [Minisyncoccia bacterium]